MEKKELHKNQTRTQVIIPAILIGILFALIAGLLIYFCLKDPHLAKVLADYTIAMLLLIGIIVNLLILFILLFAIEKIIQWRKDLPEVMSSPQEKISSLENMLLEIMDKAAEPFIAVESWFTAVKNAFGKEDRQSKS